MTNHINFAQMSQPPLKADKYSIEVKTVSTVSAQFKPLVKEFVVTTDRFQFKPDLIYSVYPPPNAVGEYDECLPNIVLNRSTLPWELDVCADDPKVPWLALLVFDNTEGISLIELTVKDIKSSSEKILTPQLGHIYEAEESLSCNVIDVPTNLVKEILPYRDELALLSHVKGVSLLDKVTDPVVTDNWFSTVMTNRLSLSPASDSKDDSILHLACLVSLEGYTNLINNEDERDSQLSGYEAVRFIVLASWNYYMTKKTFDFRSTMNSLNANIISSPFTHGAEHENDEPDDIVQTLSKLNYFPMNHHFRDGSKLVSWYQSPLIPYIEADKIYAIAMLSDQLLRYDPVLGMFDTTYANAWQIGRSMALADIAFATNVIRWRESNEKVYFKAIHTSFVKKLMNQRQSMLLGSKRSDLEEALSFIREAYSNKNVLKASSSTPIREVVNDNVFEALKEMMSH